MAQEFSSINKINTLLENEKSHFSGDCWSKLSKQKKLIKLYEYSEQYCKEHNLTKDEETVLNSYFKTCIEKKKINKKTDIKYNKETQCIEEVYNLLYHKVNKKFTIRKIERCKKTIKNKKT